MSMKSTFPAFPKNDTDLFQCGRTKRTAYHVYHVLKWDATTWATKQLLSLTGRIVRDKSLLVADN